MKRAIPKAVMMSLVLSLALVALSAGVSAEFWSCFSNGQQINFCNPAIPDRTCDSTLCKFCMNDFDSANSCYNSGSINVCNSLSSGCTLGSGEVDSTPPELTITSPTNEELLNTRNVFFDIAMNEDGSIHYMDLLDSRPRWVRFCDNCASFVEERRFEEGMNHIRIRGTDDNGNEVFAERIFYVDGSEPRIRGIEPDRDFVNGTFVIEFDEENPEILTLHYGNDQSGMLQKDLNVASDCVVGDRETRCETTVNVDAYDGELLEFWFYLEDKAGSSDTSDVEELPVDNTAPIIYHAEYIQNGRNGELLLNIEEFNLDEVEYIDHLDERGRWKRLCSRTVNEVCNGRTNLDDGNHQIEIRARDEAGNEASLTMPLFFTDSQEPKIRATRPRRGYANGIFEVDYDEENPKELLLHYGTPGAMQQYNVPFSTCNEERRGTTCIFNVNLDAYDGEEITYYATMEDLVGNMDQSREEELMVDLTAPVITNNVQADLVIDDRRVEILLDVTELNFDEAEYMDVLDDRPRWRRLCSRLDDFNEVTGEGTCEGRGGFREGPHELSIVVYDEAGNSHATSVAFEIFE